MCKIRYISLSGLFVFSLSTGLFKVYGQDTTNTIGSVSIASPTAASLGKYGDVPVGYNTGVPNVNIPIYTVNSGGLSLPINLSYHASGLKVQEQASWVGAGWSLNAGGVITRTVMGAPDDRGVGSFNICTNGHYSDYGYNSYQWIQFAGPGTVHGEMPDDPSFARGFKDGEPDLFFFNFGNYTGKFYFNDDRTPILVPEQDFKITPDLLNGPNYMGFQGFVVTTPDGVKYYFGKTGSDSGAAPIEITTPSTLRDGYTAANEAVSSWFLNKVVSADGMDSINLSYASESYSYYTMSFFPVTNQNDILLPTDPLRNGYSVVKNFVQGVRLNDITFPNGRINFTPSSTVRTDLTAGFGVNNGMYDATNTNSYSLGSISIANSSGFCKKDSFSYSYFFDSNPYTINSGSYGGLNLHSDQYRLRLDSVQESSCDASLKVPPYKFSYFSELVPRKLSFGIDHWGFSNGVTTNQTPIPTYFVTANTTSYLETVVGGNRDPAWPAMRGGALQQITYPTGGSVTLNFESNDTYVTYNAYARTFKALYSVGYGNAHTTSSFTTDNTSNTYELDMASIQAGAGGGTLQFTGPAGSLNQNLAVNSNQLDTAYFYLSPNTTYTVQFFDNAGETSDGIQANLYEAVSSLVQGNVMVGGLRIKSMTTNDAVTPNSMTTSYSYTTGGIQSSGILYSRPIYVMPIRNDAYAMANPNLSAHGCISADNGNPAGNGSIFYSSPASIMPMSTVQGNHIGYNQVQVSQTNNGYSIYQYYGSNIWDFNISDVCIRTINENSCPLSIPNFPAPPEPFEFMRGELKSEAHYNQAGQVLKNIFYFPKYVQDPLTTPAIMEVSLPLGIFGYTPYGLYSYTQYSLQSARKVEDSIVSIDVDPANSNSIASRNITYYGSLFHHQPTRKVIFTSMGDSLATNTQYAQDFRIAACDAIPDSLPFYLSALLADTAALVAHLGICTGGGNGLCWHDTLEDYRYNINAARLQFLRYRRRSYAPDSANLLSNCYISALPGSDTLLKPILRLQNMFDMAPIEVSQWKNLNLLHANFTRYDTSVNPVGFAYPGRTKLINLQAPSSSFINASISGNTILKDARYIDESLYMFSNAHPLQVISPDGISNSYIWDYLNTQPIAKVTNASPANIAYTSFEANGKGNWVFGGAPISDVTSPTGSSCYSLSGGSITRSGLTSSSAYIVSYWIKSTTTPLTITGTQAGYPIQGKTIGAWTYFEHKITGQNTATISGTQTIDELRLYPSTAQMGTYTYTPMIGMTSSCDMNNRITYYFYDNLGRLKWIKDQDGNIIKTIQYHYRTIAGNFY